MDDEFLCDKCNQTFKYKSFLEKHLNKKIPCNKKEIIDNSNDIEVIKREYNYAVNKITKCNKKTIDNFCGFCKNTFASKTNLVKHIKNVCKIKKKLELETQLIKLKYDLLKEKEKNKEINKEINKENKEKNTQNITNITNNNTQNITNITNNLTLQIRINSYGDEDLSHITFDDYKNCLEKTYPGLFKYIQLVHLNKDAPQNHNILLTNERSKFIKVFKNGKFRREYKDDILEEILDNNMIRLEKKAQELEGQLNNKIIQNHKEFKRNYYFNDKDIAQRNKDKVESMLLDDNNIVKETHKNEILNKET